MLRLKKKQSVIIAVVVVLFACGLAWRLTYSPEQALHRFYTYGDDPNDMVGEDMLMDPLILAGENLVPLVIEAIKNREMARRPYAIAFLGKGSCKQAIPVVEQILKDESEKDYFRGDALQSIYLTDAALGLGYAQAYKNSTDYVGKISNDMLNGKDYIKERRSYFAALIGKQD